MIVKQQPPEQPRPIPQSLAVLHLFAGAQLLLSQPPPAQKSAGQLGFAQTSVQRLMHWLIPAASCGALTAGMHCELQSELQALRRSEPASSHAYVKRSPDARTSSVGRLRVIETGPVTWARQNTVSEVPICSGSASITPRAVTVVSGKPGAFSRTVGAIHVSN